MQIHVGMLKVADNVEGWRIKMVVAPYVDSVRNHEN